MAVVANNSGNTDSNQQNQQQKGQNSLNPLQTVGTAASGGSAPAGTPQAQQQSSALGGQSQSGSGRFTNLQKYLQANQGGSQRIAQNITNSYDKQAQAVNQGIQQAQGQLNGQVNPLQQQLTQGAQTLNQGFQDPNAVLADATQTQNFQNMYGGQAQNVANIAGTQSLQQQQLAQQNADLQNTAGLAGTEQGRFQLLRNSVSNPGYTQGAQRLDQTLLQSQPTVANNLQSTLQNTAGGVNQNLQGLSQDSIAKINTLKGLSQDRVDQWGNLLQNGTDSAATGGQQLNQEGLGDIGSDVQGQYDALKTALPQQQQAYQDAFNKNSFTSQQLNALGLQGGMNTYGLSGADLAKAGNFNFNDNLSDYATGGADQAANQDQVDRYNALRNLAGQGQNPSIFAGQTAGYNPVSFNKDTLQTALNQKKDALNSDLKTNTQNALNRILQMGNTAGTGFNWSGGIQQQLQSAAGQLKQQLNNPNINADQVAAIINSFNKATGLNNWQGNNTLQNTLNNIYSTYDPSMAATLGQQTPEAKPLPADWQNSVPRPQGK